MCDIEILKKMMKWNNPWCGMIVLVMIVVGGLTACEGGSDKPILNRPSSVMRLPSSANSLMHAIASVRIPVIVPGENGVLCFAMCSANPFTSYVPVLTIRA